MITMILCAFAAAIWLFIGLLFLAVAFSGPKGDGKRALTGLMLALAFFTLSVLFAKIGGL